MASHLNICARTAVFTLCPPVFKDSQFYCSKLTWKVVCCSLPDAVPTLFSFQTFVGRLGLINRIHILPEDLGEGWPT